MREDARLARDWSMELNSLHPKARSPMAVSARMLSFYTLGPVRGASVGVSLCIPTVSSADS